MEKPVKVAKKKGRPKNPGGARTPAQRQASYRKKKLDEGIEISLFLTHKQAGILREKALKDGKTQSEVVGGLLEQATPKIAES